MTLTRKISRVAVQLLTEHRGPTLLAFGCVVATVVMVGGAFVIYDMLVAPSVPDVQIAAAPQIGDFLANPRGLARLPHAEKARFLAGAFEQYRQPQKRRQLVRYLQTLPSEQREQIRDTVLNFVEDQFLEDLDEYNETPEQLRDDFVDNSLIRAGLFMAELRGDGPDTDLTLGMRGGLPSGSDLAKLNKFIINRTHAQDRARAQSFVARCERRAKELRVSRRAQQEFIAKAKRLAQR